MASARALANQEREAQTKRLGVLAKALLLSAATFMTFATVALLLADNLYRPDSFVIDQLKIKGKFKYLSAEEVQAAVFEKPVGNFFSIELDEIKHRIEQLAWVQNADVRREWPHTLAITVREHRPVMRWTTINESSDGRQKSVGAEEWVSLSGQIISLDTPLNQSSTIKLRGTKRDARELLTKAMLWQKQLAPSGLRILDVSLRPSQAWSLRLAYLYPGSDFELLLGRENVGDRLARFQTLFDRQFKHANQRLIRVDARYPDGLAVEAKDLPAEAADERVSILRLRTDVNSKGFIWGTET